MMFYKRILKKIKNFHIPKFTKNFYFLTGFFLFIWMLFFDTNDFISQWKWKRRYERLQREKNYYQELSNSLKEQIRNQSETEKFEKFAREKHLLQRENEDVFLIVEEDKK
ncbi:MAG: septum formation initiator family protein [Thermonemataceae bacterium]|nr:septum formation initiator family protein [Thermonemataceae bacterium]